METCTALDWLEQRATWITGSHPRDPALAEILGATTPNTAGEVVTPKTALGLSAYYACIRNISEDCAKFPFKHYRADGPRRIYLADSAVNALLLRAPNPEQTPIDFWTMMYHWALGWRKGIAEIQRNDSGQPVALWPIHPSRVTPDRTASGKLFWRVVTQDGRGITLDDQNVFNLHGLGDDGAQGYQIVGLGADSIGRALAAQRFSGAFFGNGTTFGVVFEHPGRVGDKAKAALRESVVARHATASNAFKVFVTEEGMKLSQGQLGIAPEQAQMLETLRFTVEDLARWFRVPTSKLQHWQQAKGWSTLDAENKDYYFDALTPWHLRAQQEANRKLLPAGAGGAEYTKHTINFLMWADPLARGSYLETRMKNGTLTVNEWRQLEDDDPIGPDGDVYWIQANNLQPVNKVLTTDAENSKPTLPEFKEPEADEDKRLQMASAHLRESFTSLLADAYQRIIRIEVDKLRRGARRRDFETWSDGFLSAHLDYVRSAIQPVVGAYAEARAALLPARPESFTSSVQAEISAMALRHIEESRRRLHADAQDPETWLDGRPQLQAGADMAALSARLDEPQTTKETEHAHAQTSE